MSKPRPIGQLFAGQNRFSRLTAAAERLQALTGAVREQLDPNLALHCTVASLEEGVLVIQTDGNAWASRLRYESAELMRRLDYRLGPLHEVRIRIAPVAQSEPPTIRPNAITAESASVLASAAEAMTDPRLKAAFRRLSSRAKRT